MRLMLHLRVFVPPARAGPTLEALRGVERVHDIVHIPRAEVLHGEDLITASVDPTVAIIENTRDITLP